MIADKSHNYISPEEYLKAEESSPIKHEYRDGKIYAIAGANDAHVTLMGNLVTLLRNHVRGTDCRVYMSDMKTRIESKNTYYYPDVMVTCDQRDRANSSYKKYPRLVVEVLSPSTEAFDRGDKFADYREIESLTEYVVISQKRQQVDCFRRNNEGLWVLHSYGENSEVQLASIDFTLGMDALYEDVEFTQENPPEQTQE